MKKFNLFVPIMAALLVGGTLAPVQSAEAAEGKDFLGLWGGVDDSDGSSVTVSVTETDGDGVFHILWNESAWGFCNGGPNALIDVSGTIQGNSIIATGKLTCFDTGEDVCFGIEGCSAGNGPAFSFNMGADNTLTNADGGNLITVHKVNVANYSLDKEVLSIPYVNVGGTMFEVEMSLNSLEDLSFIVTNIEEH